MDVIVRFRNNREREDVLTGELTVKRNATVASRPAYWKAGAKIVARDKTQNREHQNYRLGLHAGGFRPRRAGADDYFGGVGPRRQRSAALRGVRCDRADRLSYNSPSLGTLGTNADTDNYGDSYTTLDAKVSVPLNQRLRSFLELRNLNDEPRRRYSGVPDHRTSHELYSWNLFAGIDWRF